MDFSTNEFDKSDYAINPCMARKNTYVSSIASLMVKKIQRRESV